MSEIPANQPQPSGSQPNPSPQYYAQPAFAPPRKQGMSATKIVLIVVGVFLALGIVGVCVLGAGVYFLAKSAHRDANGQISMNLPGASIHSIAPDKVVESDFGVPFYPGARCLSGTRTETSGFTQLSATFVTADSSDNVIAFYKQKAGSGAQTTVMPFGVGTQLTIPAQAGSTISIIVAQSKGSSPGMTRIQIARSTQSTAAK